MKKLISLKKENCTSSFLEIISKKKKKKKKKKRPPPFIRHLRVREITHIKR